jgi:hypothetical protein
MTMPSSWPFVVNRIMKDYPDPPVMMTLQLSFHWLPTRIHLKRGLAVMCFTVLHWQTANVGDICRGDMLNASNEQLIEAVLGHDLGQYEYFTNCLGFEMFSEEQALLKGVVKTPKRKASFLDNWSDSPSVVLHALLFLWQKCRNRRVHHFADMFLADTIANPNPNQIGWGHFL